MAASPCVTGGGARLWLPHKKSERLNPRAALKHTETAGVLMQVDRRGRSALVFPLRRRDRRPGPRELEVVGDGVGGDIAVLWRKHHKQFS